MTVPVQPQQPVQPAPVNTANVTTRKPLVKRWWFWAIIVIAILVIGGAIGGTTGGSSGQPQQTSSTAAPQSKQNTQQQSTPAESEKTIELQATATGNGTVIWTKHGGSNTEQFNGTWSKTFTGDETKELTGLSVTGDLTGGNDQKVTCRVIVNGEEREANEGTGAAGSAYCTVPLF